MRWCDLKKGDVLVETDGPCVLLMLADARPRAHDPNGDNGTRAVYLVDDTYKVATETRLRDDDDDLPVYLDVIRAG